MQYVRDKIRLLRLCGNGAVSVTLHSLKVEVEHFNMWVFDLILPNFDKFHLDDVEHASGFIQENTLPFSDPDLQSAFDAYELSYATNNPSLSLISCIISLEILLNPGHGEVSSTVSRNLAALLGTNTDDSEGIYHQMKSLYSLRSKVVHGGESKPVPVEKLEKSRELTRRAIRKWLLASTVKEDMIKTLRQLGFDQRRSWNSP